MSLSKMTVGTGFALLSVNQTPTETLRSPFSIGVSKFCFAYPNIVAVLPRIGYNRYVRFAGSKSLPAGM